MKPGSTSSVQHLPEAEPTVAAAPAPVWIFVVLGLLGYWGMYYLDGHGGGFNSEVYAPYRSFAYVDSLQPKSEGAEMIATGMRVYSTYCTQCHQSTGQGLPGQFPPLAGSEWVAAQEPGRIIRLVLDGIQGPGMVVKGQNFNGAMPPWRDLLKDEEIAAVLTYVRQNQAWGNSAPPVSVERVKAIREKTASRGASWTPDELLKVAEAE